MQPHNHANPWAKLLTPSIAMESEHRNRSSAQSLNDIGHEPLRFVNRGPSIRHFFLAFFCISR
jgi:hypothetical protein